MGKLDGNEKFYFRWGKTGFCDILKRRKPEVEKIGKAVF